MSSNVVIPTSGGVLDEPLLPRATARVSWGAIFAGLVVALGTWILLTVLGLAIGLSSVDPSHPASLKSGGMFSGIWSAIVPLVALFFGGLVSARTAGVLTRPMGAIHGIVVWALATIASLMLVGTVVRGVVNAAVAIGGEVANVAGSAVSSATGQGGAIQKLGIRSDDLLGPVNDRLRAEGKPPVTSAQLDATLQDIARSGVRQGRLDHDLVVNSLARHTQLTRADADDIATDIENRISTASGDVGRNVATGIAKAADTTGKAMWWVFIGMAIGLGASVVGASVGVSRRQRLAARRILRRDDVVTEVETPLPPPHVVEPLPQP